MSRVHPQIGDSDSKVADIANSATNSIVQAIAEELIRLGLLGGLGDDRNLRKIVYQMVLSRITETQSGIPDSGETSTIERRFKTLPARDGS